MNPYQFSVAQFHVATDSTVGDSPELRDAELRAKLILEEAVETVAAMGFDAAADLYTPASDAMPRKVAVFRKTYKKPDFPDAIDGLCDLLYVVFGTAVAWGIDLDPFFKEVHRANLTKFTGPKREDGKQLKPPGWSPPNIDKILIQQCLDADIHNGEP